MAECKMGVSQGGMSAWIFAGAWFTVDRERGQWLHDIQDLCAGRFVSSAKLDTPG
jgi:hypothetical protein